MPRELPTINWHSQLLEEGLRETKEKEMKPEKRRPGSNYGKGKGLSTGIHGDCRTPRTTCQVHCHSQLYLAAREATGVKRQHRLESSRGSSFHTCSSIHKNQSHGKSFSDKVSLDCPKYYNPPCLRTCRVWRNLPLTWEWHENITGEETVHIVSNIFT